MRYELLVRQRERVVAFFLPFPTIQKGGYVYPDGGRNGQMSTAGESLWASNSNIQVAQLERVLNLVSRVGDQPPDWRDEPQFRLAITSVRACFGYPDWEYHS